jgi:hypothetical protein
MSREYVLSAGGITLANQAVTLAFVNPGTGQSIEILRAWASQSANATSAQQRVQTNTQVTAFPTLTSATPGKLKLSDPVSVIVGGTAGAAGTCGINASAEGAGSKTVLMSDAFNVLNGHLWVATPPETYVMNASASAGFGYHFPVAAATLTNWAFGLIFREL